MAVSGLLSLPVMVDRTQDLWEVEGLGLRG